MIEVEQRNDSKGNWLARNTARRYQIVNEPSIEDGAKQDLLADTRLDWIGAATYIGRAFYIFLAQELMM